MQGYQFILDGRVYRFRLKKTAKIYAYHYSKTNSQLEGLIKSITKIQ
jgi:hypothetical protein